MSHGIYRNLPQKTVVPSGYLLSYSAGWSIVTATMKFDCLAVPKAEITLFPTYWLSVATFQHDSRKVLESFTKVHCVCRLSVKAQIICYIQTRDVKTVIGKSVNRFPTGNRFSERKTGYRIYRCTSDLSHVASTRPRQCRQRCLTLTSAQWRHLYATCSLDRVSMWLRTCIALLSPAVFSLFQRRGDR